ncbi:MAG: TetM/TetW/TetO/TetS family tetracycline resistance ribosomal protection protein [Spirochaetaceae bacterium]
MVTTYKVNQKVLNIGIFAHVDAGKTTITEHLLYTMGVINKTGRVDHGDTITDSMSQEKKRGITIQAQPVSFPINDIKVNLIDTPGHTDFVAEVERSMTVLDGAILVLSAKEGVQAHTYLLFHSLKKLGIPFIIFINKIDRLGSDTTAVISEVKKSLSKNVISLQEVFSEGSKDAEVSKLFCNDKKKAIDIIADHDIKILDDYVNDRKIPIQSLTKSIVKFSKKGIVYPLLFGSALSGKGIEELVEAIELFLPATLMSDSGEVGFKVFKITRTKKGIKKFYIKLECGKLSIRDIVEESKISKIEILQGGKEISCDYLLKGDIGIIYGVDLKIGDVIGNVHNMKHISLGTPTLKAGIKAINPDQKSALVQGVNKIAEGDPFLEYELHEGHEEIYLNFFGEVQIDIVKDILLESYDVEVEILEQMVIYKETPVGSGEAVMEMLHDGNPYWVTLGLRVEKAEQGSGLKINREVRTSNLPTPMWHGIDDGIKSAVRQGLKGWQVTDLIVTVTKVEYKPPTTPSDFRDVAPMLVLEALNKGGTTLLWPVLDFELKVPELFYGKAVSDLLKMKAEFSDPVTISEVVSIQGVIPVETSRDYTIELADYTSGKGIMVSWFSCYTAAVENIKRESKKIFPDPLNKALYIMSKRGMVS